MVVRLSVEIGPSEDELDQVLEIDVDDLLEVLERVQATPVVWVWHLPDGGTVRLRGWLDDTPEVPPTPKH